MFDEVSDFVVDVHTCDAPHINPSLTPGNRKTHDDSRSPVNPGFPSVFSNLLMGPGGESQAAGSYEIKRSDVTAVSPIHSLRVVIKIGSKTQR